MMRNYLTKITLDGFSATHYPVTQHEFEYLILSCDDFDIDIQTHFHIGIEYPIFEITMSPDDYTRLYTTSQVGEIINIITNTDVYKNHMIKLRLKNFLEK